MESRNCLGIMMAIFSMLFGNSGLAYADSGGFSTLTYNIAGLPQILSSAESDRQEATELISCYVNAFDFINVQEDFNYHAALYDTCNDHPYRSPTSGDAGIGSGLNSMSRFSYMDWTRITWDDCNGVDCLTPKGFTLARTRLCEGVYVDIYNLHAQAQTDDGDLAARRANILQLAVYIETNSAGNAVIVMGDTNTRYTRAGDNIRELLNRGFTDVWVSRVRDGDVPESGTTALVCDPAVTSAHCEVVDKVLYRDNGYVGLTTVGYQVREDAYNDAGEELSDHRPIQADWTYDTAPDRRLSDLFGGPYGDAFNDISLLPEKPAAAMVSIRSGERIDQVEITLADGYILSHGGTGGNPGSLSLESGEYLSSLCACSGEVNGKTRIFYARFTTSAGRSLEGGTSTSDCETYSAPVGWQIVGFHGRAGDEVDKLGVIYAPYDADAGAESAAYAQLVNNASGLCMDILDAEMASGTDVIQWTCNGGDGQKWNYDAYAGLIRSKLDPRYCLDNGGSFVDGADIRIRLCSGSADQRFTIDDDGVIRVRTLTEQVVGGYGTASGDDVGTWTFQGGANQHWRLVFASESPPTWHRKEGVNEIR